MKKALIVATVGCFFRFELNDIKILRDKGIEVHCASNFKEYQDHIAVKELNKMEGVILHQVPFSRSPLKKENYVAFKVLKKILEDEFFDLVHCHTPVGGVITRLVANKYRKKGTKVLYTAHGFHFFKGAHLFNWLVYYPIEWSCSWLTDCLITINTEDFYCAKKHFNAKDTKYIPGVGIDLEQFASKDVNHGEKRFELEVDRDDVLLLSVGELNKNKNYEVVIRALAKLNNNKLHYAIAARGALKDYLENLAKELNVEKQVHLLGYRTDIKELLYASDIFIMPSLREGLSVALMEAIATNKVVICSDIRGNNDLIKNSNYRFNPHSVNEMAECILYILGRDNKNIVQQNYENLLVYDKKNVSSLMNRIYEVYV